MILAVDIGGTNTKLARVTNATHTSHEVVFPTASARGEDLVSKIGASAPLEGVVGIAVSVAGFLSDERDRLIYNPNLPWLVGFPLRDSIRNAFHLPVVLEVDSNAACLAEQMFGAGRVCRRFLCLTGGTGLGGGMIVDGEVLRINGACIGDVGHVIVDPYGLECSCGGHGCAEAHVGTERIAKRAGFPSFHDLLIAAGQGDVEARAEVATAGHALGPAITSLVHIFAPERVAIAGGLSEAGDLLISAARDSFRYTAGTAFRDVQIIKAVLGSKAPLIGAAAAFFREASVRIQ